MTTNEQHGSRPPFTRPGLVLLVFAGGVLGTAAREAVVLANPAGVGGVFIVNLVGAFALGLLVGRLRRRASTPRRRAVRLFVGTGVLGGFTTYSALATDTALLLQTQPAFGAAYAVGSVVLGLVCAAAGLAIASVGEAQHPDQTDAAP